MYFYIKIDNTYNMCLFLVMKEKAHVSNRLDGFCQHLGVASRLLLGRPFQIGMLQLHCVHDFACIILQHERLTVEEEKAHVSDRLDGFCQHLGVASRLLLGRPFQIGMLQLHCVHDFACIIL